MTTKIPTTMEDAIDMLVVEMPETSRMMIKQREITTHVSVHHGYGTSIRNDLSLWDDNSPIVKHFRERFGLGHADDISGILTAGVFAAIRGVPFDPLPQVERYKAHWEKEGLDPVTNGPQMTSFVPAQRKRNWWAYFGLRRGD
ncbi:hypothetical protein BAJUN_03200 [Bajunvirus bajun]|uniref:DUF6794 domain-containing protein n=1 Tax=Brevundimonas phage vB_BgoS-Bajun TaxID=2948594 RepID=A0A9E7N7K0_9CAUD|nr:hypothetical protein BAJUN_03200 [Brevundimonas phage vB_BgoS-Bajun]